MMMMSKKEHIGQLIEKYLDGDTTNAEEQVLREYFGQTDASEMPDEWRVYRALFGYVAASAVKGAGGSTESAVCHTGIAVSDVKEHRSGFAAVVSSMAKRLTPLRVAAAILVIVTLALLPRTPRSYVVIDGKVYTDRIMMEREAEEALSLVASGSADDDPFGALRLMEQ